MKDYTVDQACDMAMFIRHLYDMLQGGEVMRSQILELGIDYEVFRLVSDFVVEVEEWV